jgi:formate hydrogenlyase subunit 3/multisubunit Na+/H+ antiporter MnhD subunit
MTLFSILFGAGVLLMTRSAEARTGRSAAIHYRRMLWLLLIGLLHAYVIWYGDILVLYAVCGMAVYPLRRLRPRLKVAIALVVMLIPTAVMVGFGSAVSESPEQVEELRANWDPPPETVAEEVAVYRSGWWGQMAHRVPTSVQFETVFTVLFGLWRAGGLMLLGIALYRWGVLTGERSRRFDSRLALAGLGLGLPVVAWGLRGHLEAGFSFPYSMFSGEIYNYWAAPLVSLGYIGDGVRMEIGFLVDRLTALMMVVVTFVSLMVHIYTIGYMHDDPGYQRFFSYISLFTFSMLMLVMSNNFLQLFFGWEAVGLVSYLLIGFWFKRESAIFANLKAFLVNRVGDFGFILGIAGIVAMTNSLDYAVVFSQADDIAGRQIEVWTGVAWNAMTLICILLFIGAMGKSAQAPLHVWLPDSMEARHPSPRSFTLPPW